MDLRINDEITIPERELDWTFLPSGGPGGQHANRTASKVVLRFDPASSSAFDQPTRTRVLDRVGGVISVTVDDSRSQWRNRQIARERLSERIEDAIALEPPGRKATRPSRASAQRRVDGKRLRARVKRLRKPPTLED